jgi:anaerobic selenocysteine-containing dehydrogenase
MVGYVEDGRLVKLEGHPKSIRSLGKMCAKGGAGINQLYDPDRILYPMKRVGKRGEGKWKRVSWDDALGELTGHLKKLRDGGHPEKFMFHYGLLESSARQMIEGAFLSAYGTKTIGNHMSICQAAKWTAQELTWGKHYDNWDFDNAKYVLNFGSAVQEAHHNHIPTAQRLTNARIRGVKLVTFDVRLSNTAAKSAEWVPIKPGADGAVALAMCKVIMDAGLHDKEFFKFIKATPNPNASTDEKVAALKTHLTKYTPEWAEKISGVTAAKIKSIATEFAKTKPACVISSRGAIAHHNGTENERAIQMLAAITGNIDNPGGRCRAVKPQWEYPKGPKGPEPKGLEITNGFTGKVAYPTHGIGHQVLKMIKDGKAGRPEVYMCYCYNPAYSNGECKENIDILKDESLIPYSVCVTPYYDESAALADLILPDSSYLERWDWEDNASPVQIPEYYIRQPLVKPVGESRDFKDVVCELASKVGFPLGFNSAEEFVKKSCEMTAAVKGAGGFEYMKTHGVWHDSNAKAKYYGYKEEVKGDDLKKAGVALDEATGVYWNANQAEAKGSGYTDSKGAYRGYVGQKIGDKVYKGFEPDRLNKSGYFELYSELLKIKGLPPLPTYGAIAGHEKMGANDLVLTTFKLPVHRYTSTPALPTVSGSASSTMITRH